MNSSQILFLKKFLEENECTFKVPEWDDFKGIHSHQIEFLYKKLKDLEIK